MAPGERAAPVGSTKPQGFDRLAATTVERARLLSTATLHEAGGKTGAMPSAIKPAHPRFSLCGPALPVQGPGGDNLWIHRAIYAARPGDILVVSCSSRYEHGYWGEIMSSAARAKRLGGLVIDGCVRDFELLETVGFPVFARGLSIRGTCKDREAAGWINAPTQFGDIMVNPGDLVRGDADGVVVVQQSQAERIVNLAERREADELEVCRRLERGESTLEIYGLA